MFRCYGLSRHGDGKVRVVDICAEPLTLWPLGDLNKIFDKEFSR